MMAYVECKCDVMGLDGWIPDLQGIWVNVRFSWDWLHRLNKFTMNTGWTHSWRFWWFPVSQSTSAQCWVSWCDVMGNSAWTRYLIKWNKLSVSLWMDKCKSTQIPWTVSIQFNLPIYPLMILLHTNIYNHNHFVLSPPCPSIHLQRTSTSRQAMMTWNLIIPVFKL